MQGEIMVLSGRTLSPKQWRLLRGGRLILMAGMVPMEWHQKHGNHGNHVFDVFDTIPLQPLPQAGPPQLRCHQPPVVLNDFLEEVKQNVTSCTFRVDAVY